MCVIAALTKGTILPSYHLLKAAWDTNPHGAGFMYPRDNELVIVKGLMTFNAFKSAFSHHRRHMSEPTDNGPRATVDVCVHFRIRSHGPTNAEMTHPFAIPGHPNVAIAHNGIISGLRHSETVSDTVVYIEDVLSKLPLGWQKSRPIRGLIERDIGRSNKIVIMDEKGIRAILNRSSGFVDAQTQVWWSNNYHLTGRPERRSSISCNMPDWAGWEDGEPPEGSPFPLSCASRSSAVFAEPEAPVSPAMAEKPAPRAVVRSVSGSTPIITKAVYEPDTGEMIVSLRNQGNDTIVTQRLSMAEADALRRMIRKGEYVSECTIKGNPSFVEIYAAMKAHHDATK